ncbi:MAG: hypothetical protein M3138_09710 [Actinomycetota bacterium]|nr:hypothetical protein [Actinomycetota bacterium]
MRPAAGASHATLFVAAERCLGTRCRGTAFAARLDPSEFSLDPDLSRARLATSLTGRRLVIRWRCGDSCETTGGAIVVSGTGSTSSTEERSLGFDGRLFGIECAGVGHAQRELLVNLSGGPEPIPSRRIPPLPRRLFEGPMRPSC